MHWDENFVIGADLAHRWMTRTTQVPFRFNGELNKLILTIDRPKLSPADLQKLMEAQRNRVSEEGVRTLGLYRK
jgi:arylsulfatase